MDLFVPGRLCLFGEHSDWAGQYRQTNPELMPGYAIVTGINRGIYAYVKRNSYLVFKTLHSSEELRIAMEADLLLKQAQTADFYSYVAGTAYQAFIRYRVGGLAIDNYRMDLPLKKGLSSSAAICVLVAKAFNQLYDLGLSLTEEMDLAYWGERTTFSQCGKLDQACAYGRQPILMTFDGDRTAIEPLTVAQELYLIIVDLAGCKDTQEILARLNQGYPIAKNNLQKQVQHYLGAINANLVRQAQFALQQGDAATLGGLMQQAQAQFDRCVAPACPTQLDSPILHKLLSYKPLLPYIYGGKGVGSQGDGTAQLMARNRDCQQQAIAAIERYFPQMHCYELNIPQNRTMLA
jgi:galactokinase